MEHIIYSVGIDVDKKSFKACLKNKEGNKRSVVKATRTFINNPQGFRDLQEWIEKNRKGKETSLSFTMEATGVYHEPLAWHLYGLEYRVHIVLPTRAKRYMQSLGIRSKNDPIDATGLADMGLQQELTPWKPASESILALRSLTRQVEMFQETRTTLRNQLEAARYMAFADPIIVQNLTSMIEAFKNDLNKLNERIAATVQQDPVLAQKYELVKPITGIGVLTFATLVAETGGFELFNNQKQLVSYAGYDVIENQSGGRVGKTRISKQGNTHIRRILFMASLNMVRFRVSPFLQLYERVHERTKIKMKAYVAVQRKLLCLIYALWKKDAVYDAGHQTMENYLKETQKEVATT